MSTREYMARPPAAGFRFTYGTAPEQFGDLRVPRGNGLHPVAIVVHGGWWRSGFNLEYAGHLAAALTKDGFATWNIEYRRVGSPNGGYPALLRDVSAAVSKLTSLAPAHALDLNRIVVVGHSAGGHIAAWLAAKKKHRALDVFGPALDVIGAVPVAGALDLALCSEMGVSDSAGIPVHDFLGGTPAAMADRYALASPAQLLPTGIPTICVHGDEDANVPLAISESYVQKAREAGDDARLVVLPGVDHFSPFDPDTTAGAAVREAVRELITR
jgi:acetyl esterase/lipase